jgi:hypothetical protein
MKRSTMERNIMQEIWEGKINFLHIHTHTLVVVLTCALSVGYETHGLMDK